MTQSIGDLAQSLLLQSRSRQLRTDIQTLSQELTTGQSADVTRRLDGDFAALSGLEHQLGILDSMSVARADAMLLTDTAQANISQLMDSVGDLGFTLLSVGNTPTARVLSGLPERTQAAFENAVANLNGSVAGRAVFFRNGHKCPPIAQQ